jgi:uncharacterized MnhB-related membrane protein
MIFCAVLAIRSSYLLQSAIWLAGSSALTAILLYLMGAPQIAVIELSVGAGLVTVLFVFAINITGEDASTVLPSIPRPAAWAAVILVVAAFAWMVLPGQQPAQVEAGLAGFSTVLWQDRAVDMALQVVLIFAGVLGILTLLGKPAAAGEPEGGDSDD